MHEVTRFSRVPRKFVYELDSEALADDVNDRYLVE